jgi:1-deoxyxylulose-5-phosphate synthase
MAKCQGGNLLSILMPPTCAMRDRGTIPANGFTQGHSPEVAVNGYSRRDFIKTGIAAGTLASVGTLPVSAATATDKVTLGNSGLQVTRLAFGTGSNNGHVQYALGQAEFTKLVRYAYDRGIRFFETAEAYMTPAMLGEALKGLPRDSYQLMTKVTTDKGVDPQARFDEMRKTSQTEYFDIMLLHWQHTADWVSESQRWQDGINEAQEKKVILKRGASIHGLPALRQVPGNKWLEIAMIRMNHNGTVMDSAVADDGKPGDVSEVVQHVKQVKQQGMGVISMKLVGNGTFTRHEDRLAAMKFAFRNAGIDCATVGFKSPQEVDEAIDNMNAALA